MELLIGVAICVLLVGGALMYGSRRKKRQANQPAQLPAGESDGGRPLTNLQIDDIVSHVGTDYIVEGRINYQEGRYKWVEYMLVDSEQVRWLCVEADDQLEVTLWREVEDKQVTEPIPEKIDYEGETYRMYERGEAEAQQTGNTGRKRARSVDYYDYRGEEDLMGVEVWGGEVEVFRGREIDEVMLDVFPGDDVAGV